jgi:hypothetical protein
MSGRLLPERGGEAVVLVRLISAPAIVDQHVEPPLFLPDSLEQGRDLGVLRVVTPDRDAPPRPPRAVTISAASLTVPGNPSVVGLRRELCPLT